jgi:N6-adenosine-specific RNA methylase IME4
MRAINEIAAGHKPPEEIIPGSKFGPPVEVGLVVGPGTTRPALAARICIAHARTVEAAFDVGRLLIAAKNALPHGEFGTMLKTDLPFSARMAQRYMKIAADERFGTHESRLPAAPGHLYEISRLPDEQFEAFLADGTIRPDMERRDIAQAIKASRRAERERELVTKQQNLPTQRFGVIVADPEWRFEPWSRLTGMDRAADNHYPTSCTEVIAARDVPSCAADDCILFLWATAPMLPHALLVMAAWGFDYKTHLVRHKQRSGAGRGTGYWATGEHELLLIGTQGKIPAPCTAMCASLIDAPWQGRHSAKPEIFLEIIERQFPSLTKIELNRRGPPRPGWTGWGNEAQSIEHISSPAADVQQSRDEGDALLDIPSFLRRTTAEVAQNTSACKT